MIGVISRCNLFQMVFQYKILILLTTSTLHDYAITCEMINMYTQYYLLNMTIETRTIFCTSIYA